jgi:hypothetical protein
MTKLVFSFKRDKRPSNASKCYFWDMYIDDVRTNFSVFNYIDFRSGNFIYQIYHDKFTIRNSGYKLAFDNLIEAKSAIVNYYVVRYTKNLTTHV